jgi:hypothetical protein
MTAATMSLRGPLRPRRRLGPLFVAAGLAAFAVALWWAVPAVATPAYGPPPALDQPRLIELKAQGVPYARIRGLDASATSGGVWATLFAGYVDPERIALFVRLDPPARPAPNAFTLKDQFGRSYHLTGAFADVDTGENILYFEGPGIARSMTGLRLSLDIDRIERGRALEPQSTSLSLSAVLVGRDEWNGYALNMAINYVALAAAGLAYVGVTLGAVRIGRGRRGPIVPFERGLIAGVVFAVLGLPTYIAVATLFRHDPIGPGGLQRPLEDYLPAAMVAFFVIEAAALVVGALRAWQGIRGRPTARWVPLAAATAVLGFLVLTLPLAEFANACYIGVGFILKPSC